MQWPEQNGKKCRCYVHTNSVMCIPSNLNTDTFELKKEFHSSPKVVGVLLTLF